MSGEKRVRYLKVDRGRYFYQRRVPTHLQHALGCSFWRRPCGNVDYPKAVQLVVTWGEEHDSLIAELKDPTRLAEASNSTTRQKKAELREYLDDLEMPRFYEMTEQRPGEKQFIPQHRLPRPWQAAAKLLEKAEAARGGEFDLTAHVKRIESAVFALENDLDLHGTNLVVPDHPAMQSFIEDNINAATRTKIGLRVGNPPAPMSDRDFLDVLREAHEVGFGQGIEPPEIGDDRDEFEFVKRKLERKIAELSPDPSRISDVAEAYFNFNSIRSGTRSKYRRDLARLTAIVGDVPVKASPVM